MLKVAFARVKPEKVERLESWLRELMTRQAEVRETFRRETVRHEQGYIIYGDHAPLLVYVMEAEDHDRAKKAWASSELPIDSEHRAVMKDVLAEKLQVAPLYDCALPNEEPANKPLQRTAKRRR